MRSKKEHIEQVKLCRDLDKLMLAKKIITYFAVPNGGSRNIREAANLKKEGVRSGVSDIVIVMKDLVLFIELKRTADILKSGKLSTAKISVSDSQIDFLNVVNTGNITKAFICYGYQEAISKILEYIK